jgi:hypothetical protein
MNVSPIGCQSIEHLSRTLLIQGTWVNSPKLGKIKPRVAMGAFREHRLGSPANEHILECLKYGHTLSRHLLRRRQGLKEGRVITRLPLGANTGELDKFEWGGKYPPAADAKGLPSARDDLVSRIGDFLKRKEGGVCIFENYLARRTDPALSRARSRVRLYGDEVYHVLTEEDAKPEPIKAAVAEAEGLPIFIGALSTLPQGSRIYSAQRELAGEELRALADRAEKIIVGAYDGEGYLIWGSRRVQTLSVLN